MIKPLSINEFNNAINQKTTLVAFTAPWCPPCRALKPLLEEFAEDNASGANFYNVNIDDESALTRENGVMSVPTVLVFKNGIQTARGNGPFTKEKLTSLINS
ncbi:MAG: thioredoxin family protein [Firmicutes bacterium]|nr:thioredoxin family protein [Bacillota bacterium]